jgi:hypothetical protein
LRFVLHEHSVLDGDRRGLGADRLGLRVTQLGVLAGAFDLDQQNVAGDLEGKFLGAGAA